MVGALQVLSPFGLWWLPAATVYAVGLAFIAAVQVGFSVADGRPRVIVIECIVLGAFAIVAGAGVTENLPDHGRTLSSVMAIDGSAPGALPRPRRCATRGVGSPRYAPVVRDGTDRGAGLTRLGRIDREPRWA